MAKRRAGLYQRRKKRPDGTTTILKTWWIKFTKNGQVFQESTGTKVYAEAERYLKRRLGEVATGKFAGLAVERIAVNELFDDLMEDYRLNKRASIVETTSRLKNHLRPFFGEMRAADVSTAQVKRYMRQRLEAGVVSATVNRELEILKRAFTLAIKSDPPKVARELSITMLTEDNVRTGFLDDSGYLRVKEELPEYLRPLFVVGYHLGTRLGELRKLKWEQVDMAHRSIVLNPKQTKNRQGRTLPIYGEMREWLTMQREIRDARYPECDLVFHDQGEPIGDFCKAWRSACKRAGSEGLLFHDLRRSAVRNMVRAGITEKVAMQISGHKTRSIFDRYNIVNERDITEAAAKLEQRMQTSLATLVVTPMVAANAVPASNLLN
jgi:integrase